MTLKFWGTRGSCAAAFDDRRVFGGNTSCVSLRSGNCWLILDGGTGILPLATEIRGAAARPDAEPCRVKILLSHYHLDHIIGLPMFLAGLPEAAEVALYAAPSAALPGPRALNTLIGPPLCPVTLTEVCPQLTFGELRRDRENDLGCGIRIEALPANHPDGGSVFRVRWQGRDLVYGLDCEITDAWEPEYIRFAQGCGCLLFDGAYSDEDYACRIGFGHSPFSLARRIAEAAGAGQTYVLHYDYAYTDEFLLHAEREAAGACGVSFAREGQSVEL